MKNLLLLVLTLVGFNASAFEIGLSMYSLRQLFFDGTLTALEYPAFAKETFGITKIDVWEGGFPEESVAGSQVLSGTEGGCRQGRQ